MPDRGDDSGEDIIANAAATVGAFSSSYRMRSVDNIAKHLPL